MDARRFDDRCFVPRRAVRMRRASGVALGAALALLAGCSLLGGAKPSAPPQPPLIERLGKSMVRVDDGDSGARVVLERSQELVVRLLLPGGRDVEWRLVDAVPGVVGVVSGPTFERAPRSDVSNEGDGLAVWHLKALAAGSGTLVFQLRRVRSLEPATQTASYAVTVR